ncbi:MAG: transcriptional regulator [Candidatus Hydrothermarchaeota archaeon]|nr:MAG: transcriptional regulator [Candidatus Hydrothermarchaeota archaeon]
MAKESFLTEKQIKVLELRAKGYTQEQIAKILGTSRVNVTILEKKAKENVEKARKTIELFESLTPIKVTIKKDANIFEIPQIIFSEADKHGIEIVYNSTSIIGMVRRSAGDKIFGNRVIRDFEILILRSGKIIVK